MPNLTKDIVKEKENIDKITNMILSWDEFRSKTKYESRYTFLLEESNQEGILSPKEFLEAVCTFISNNHKKLIVDLSSKTKIFRAREFKYLEENFDDAKELGTPPTNCACKANRFNPIGIPIFYGSFDEDTAEKELYPTEKYVVVGEFHVFGSIKILDLTAVDTLDISDDSGDSDSFEKYAREFLIGFSKSLSSEVLDKLELDYVPTQIVSEYFYKIGLKNFNIRGIKYRSSKNHNSSNIVLFFKNEDCVNPTNKKSNSLVLTSRNVYLRDFNYLYDSKFCE